MCFEGVSVLLGSSAAQLVHCFIQYLLYICLECAIEDIQNDVIMPSTSASYTSKVDRATSPIPGCSDCKKYFILFNIIYLIIFYKINISYALYF